MSTGIASNKNSSSKQVSKIKKALRPNQSSKMKRSIQRKKTLQPNQSSNLNYLLPLAVGAGACGFGMFAGGGVLAAAFASYGFDLMVRSITSKKTPALFTKQSAKAFVGGAIGGAAIRPFAAMGATFLSESTSLLVGSSAAGVSSYISSEITGNLVDGAPINITPTGILASAAAGPGSLLTRNTIASFAPDIPQNTLAKTAVAGIAGAAAGVAAKTATNGIKVVLGKRKRSKLFKGVTKAAIRGGTISAVQSLLTPQDTSSQSEKNRERGEEDIQGKATPAESIISSDQTHLGYLVDSPPTQAGNNRNNFFAKRPTRQGATHAGSVMINDAYNSCDREGRSCSYYDIANKIATELFKWAFGPEKKQWDWPSFGNLEGKLVEDQKGNPDAHGCRVGRTAVEFFGHRADWRCHDRRITIGPSNPNNLSLYNTGGTTLGGNTTPVQGLAPYPTPIRGAAP